MKNLKGDALWAAVLAAWILMLIIPVAREMFLDFTSAHPYLSGFVKFFILASMGDLLGERISRGEWNIHQGFLMKAAVWGVLGMMITLAFTVFTAGAAAAQSMGKLPFDGSAVANAIFGSILMNATFGPMLYVYHKFGNIYIDMMVANKKNQIHEPITVKAMVDRVDWNRLVSFAWLNNCILIWMPCHSMVLLLPAEYRVLASAFLSILMGVLVAISKKNTSLSPNVKWKEASE